MLLPIRMWKPTGPAFAEMNLDVRVGPKRSLTAKNAKTMSWISFLCPACSTHDVKGFTPADINEQRPPTYHSTFLAATPVESTL